MCICPVCGNKSQYHINCPKCNYDLGERTYRKVKDLISQIRYVKPAPEIVPDFFDCLSGQELDFILTPHDYPAIAVKVVK